MSGTVAILVVAAWLGLQIPLGMLIGSYIRRGRTADAQPACLAKSTQRAKRRGFNPVTPAALLR